MICRSCSAAAVKKTFALAARFADHLNIICNASELPRKLDALHARLDEAGRDRATLETSFLAFVIVDEDGDRARKVQADLLARQGITDLSALPVEALRQTPADRQFVGTPDEVAEQLRSRVLDHGIDGLIVNLVTNGHEPGTVELAGRALAPLVRD